MKKIFFIVALCSLLLAPAAMAQVQSGDTAYTIICKADEIAHVLFSGRPKGLLFSDE